MEGLVLAFLGPYTNVTLAISLFVVALTRKSIRKSHIAFLLLTTLVVFVAFFIFFIWGFTWHDGKKSVALYQWTLRLMAATIVGCGSAVGFYFIFKSFGLTSPSSNQRKR